MTVAEFAATILAFPHQNAELTFEIPNADTLGRLEALLIGSPTQATLYIAPSITKPEK